MTIKYWLAADGKRIEDGQGQWHQKSARKHLRDIGVIPKDRDKDLYRQMFKLGFMRVAEVEQSLYADNDGQRPTDVQQHYLLAKEGEGMAVLLNTKAFEATRDGGAGDNRTS
jgi:hypothetical protein